MKKNLRKITTMAATFLLFFSFSQSVGPGYYEALDACKEAGKNAAKNKFARIYAFQAGKALAYYARSAERQQKTHLRKTA